IKLGDRPSEAQSHGRLGIAQPTAGGESQTRQHFAAATRIYEECGSLIGTAAQVMNEAVFESRLGFFERALTATHKAIALFDRAKDGRGRVGGLANLTFLLGCTGKIEEARKIADETLELARSLGFSLFEASTLENLASAEGKAGEYRRAIELAEASFEVRSRSESLVWSSQTLADVAIWQAALGNLPAARDAVQKLLADEDSIQRGSDWPSSCYWSAAQILRVDGDAAGAARRLEQAQRIMQTTANALEPEDRERFLSLPWHVDLVQAAASGVWPDPPR
ncbi:MAG: tetratricopeptide repeat protein, partial [Candidatus Baltobacteraceae bacterium]